MCGTDTQYFSNFASQRVLVKTSVDYAAGPRIMSLLYNIDEKKKKMDAQPGPLSVRSRHVSPTAAPVYCHTPKTCTWRERGVLTVPARVSAGVGASCDGRASCPGVGLA